MAVGFVQASGSCSMKELADTVYSTSAHAREPCLKSVSGLPLS